MEDQVQEVIETKPKKKKFYQKWWFWVIAGFFSISVFIGIFGIESEPETVPMETNKTSKAETTKSIETKRELSAEEYKSLCKTYTYKELARTPENYKGAKIVLTGEVIQVMESGKKVTLRVNMNNDYDQTVYIVYTLKSNEGRILEDDIVKIYGNFEGLVTYTSVLGSEITLPHIDAEYIEIIG
ncbi:MAG: hypothetical protein E7677_00625 [Ruminococcaceae bacterium]|nr:hypothetical protein [Oscillospiraceae bacterium]